MPVNGSWPADASGDGPGAAVATGVVSLGGL
jgi:hypothetical protein